MKKKMKLVTVMALSIMLVFAMMPSAVFADSDTITVNVTVKNDTFVHPLVDLDNNIITPPWTGKLFTKPVKVPVEFDTNLHDALFDYFGKMIDLAWWGGIGGFHGLNEGINIEEAPWGGPADYWVFQLNGDDSYGAVTYVNTDEEALQYVDLGYGFGYQEIKLKDGDNVLIAFSLDGTEIDIPYALSPQKTNAKSSGKTAVDIKWEKHDKATKYEVYRAKTKNGAYKLVGSPTANSYRDTGLAAGTDYYYKVKMIRGQNSSYDSQIAPVMTKHDSPKVSVSKGKKAPKISWKKVTGAQKYHVYKATKKNGNYKKVGTVGKTTFTDKKAKKGKKYFYKVKAYTSFNGTDVYSDFSNVVKKKVK